MILGDFKDFRRYTMSYLFIKEEAIPIVDEFTALTSQWLGQRRAAIPQTTTMLINICFRCREIESIDTSKSACCVVGWKREEEVYTAYTRALHSHTSRHCIHEVHFRISRNRRGNMSNKSTYKNTNNRMQSDGSLQKPITTTNYAYTAVFNKEMERINSYVQATK